MARSFIQPIEPDDLPPLEQEAVLIFVDADWCEDAKWLGPLALVVFSEADRDAADSILDDCVRHNIEVIARSMRDVGGRDRDRALLMAFARLCGCGGKAAELRHPLPSGFIRSLPQAPAGLEEWRRIALEFRKDRPHANGADFEGAIVSAGWPGDYEVHGLEGPLVEHARGLIGAGPRTPWRELPEVVRLMHVLVDAADLDLTKVVDEGAVAAAGVPRLGPDPQLRVPERPAHNLDSLKNARSLSNWVMGLGPRAVSLFFPVLGIWKSESYAAATALGVRHAIETWLLYATSHPTFFQDAGSLLAKSTRPYFDLLHQHSSRGSPEQTSAVRRAWLWFAWCTFAADPKSWNDLDETTRDAVLRAANEDIARTRKLLSRAEPKPLKEDELKLVRRDLLRRGETLPEPSPAEQWQGWGHLMPADWEGPVERKERAPWEEFEWEKDHLATCLTVLYEFGGVWRGLKPMLLAWRALRTPGVARDLRYWSERDRVPPPSPWCDLFAWPINLFHGYVWREQSVDADLTRLRGELAKFCVERLVDRWSRSEREQAKRESRARKDEDMLERSPAWRYCFIRAFGTLGVNPEGKGHRVLRMASELDPAPEVREAAHHAYQQLRRNVGLPDGVSPRRAILSALWWLRQAHLLELEIQPDPDGAQRTRMKELSRTRETERADEPELRDYL